MCLFLQAIAASSPSYFFRNSIHYLTTTPGHTNSSQQCKHGCRQLDNDVRARTSTSRHGGGH
ncbi:uncharacterized protein N7473_002586 [Penicillium subrubescens]|uniref:uncharacterized protein n=1 Tax=Penicillium subrubescens TaxID=1316194 RepID=UPI002544DA00|nr:uncharacterized protein N7473_002586 [Penicillium subrubescens]KAJ5905670.1 hypothetical protein N7473_002586 [Penicillium subrubescens]